MHRPIDPKRIEVVDDVMAQLLKGRRPDERVRMAMQANKTARLLLTTAIQNQNPNWPQERVRDEVARRMAHGAV